MRTLFSCFALILLVACGAETPGHGAQMKADTAYIIAPLGGRDVTLGGLVLVAGEADLRLASVESPSAERIEIHTMSMSEDGAMQMRKLDALSLQAGSEISLGRGGPHLMVFGLDPALKEGDMVDLILSLEHGGRAPETRTLAAEIVGFGHEPASENSNKAGHGS